MDNRYIGVFDSGLGGLTAVKEIMEVMPSEGIVYFGDTGRIPYGTRSNETIIKYVHNDIRFLSTFDIKCIVMACGTASTVAIEAVSPMYAIPIMGVVEPAAEKAAAITRNGKIGVLGTNGAIGSGKYEKELLKLNPSLQVFSKACPLFVPLVENGHTHSVVARLVAEEYLAELKKEKIDTIILGCTHYPLLKDIIYDIMDGKVQLVDPGRETAIHLDKRLREIGGHASKPPLPQYRFFVSDSEQSFSKLGSVFLHREISGSVSKVDIEQY